MQCRSRGMLCCSWARIVGQTKGGVRVNSAWRQRVHVARQRQLQDALFRARSRKERQLQRDVRPRRLCSANAAGPHHEIERALVLFRGHRGQPKPSDRGAQTRAWCADWTTIAASARRNCGVCSFCAAQQALPVIAVGNVAQSEKLPPSCTPN